jgi:hypothetical protein
LAKYFGLGSDEPSEDSEKIVAKALRTLSEDWTVLHHVVWQARRAGRQGDGEADFILIHPGRGAIVIEVKGGDIEIRDGRWKSTGSRGRVYDIKNPFEQASDSKHALIKWLDGLGLSGHLRVGHAVAFPHMDRLPNLGPAGTREISWTSKELASILPAVEAVEAHWQLRGALAPSDLRRVVSLLAPTVEVRRATHIAAARAEESLVRLTAEQVELFSGLRASRGGLILGGAGTGKTVLALARAMQLANEGFRTLLVCYNELLGADLHSRVSGISNLAAATFHSLCTRQARSAGVSIPADPDKEWWERRAAEVLVDACAATGEEYDAIIVDECQDFAPHWIEALRCLLANRSDAPLFLFGDSNQEIWDRGWKGIPTSNIVFELRHNLRNTRPIATRVLAAIGGKPSARGVEGPEPIWSEIVSTREAESRAIEAVERLIDQGFVANDIVVVCQTSSLTTRLRQRAIGPYSFGQWGGRGVAVETVARFKGLEAASVVLVLDREDEERLNAIAYVGMSRARSLLTVVGTRAAREAINWEK